MKAVLAYQLAGALRSQWRVMLAVLPGLVLTMLHSTALDLPRADVIDAIDTDHYRIQWIVGTYILGSATGMALTKVVGGRWGLRIAYLLGIGLFTIAGSACAAGSAVIWLAPLRLVQGLGTGLTISVGMVLLWRAFPVRKELAMALYGMAVYVSAMAGAPLGGLLITWTSWRLIFLINLPLGIGIGLLAARTLPADRPASPPHVPFDWFGLVLLMGTVLTLNVVLDIGQYWGWLNSPMFVPWLVGLLVFLGAFVAWGVGAPAPLINLRPLAMPHFALGLGIKVLYSCNLYVLVGLLAGYMIQLRGYQWWQGSLVFLPALATMLGALSAGVWWGNDGNRKARMFGGLALMTSATWLLSSVDVYTARGWQSIHLALWGVGAGLVTGPALLTTFEGLSNEQTLQTAGVFNILRSLPILVVSGLLGTLLTQRTDAEFDLLRQNIRWNRPIVSEATHQPENHLQQRGSAAAVAGKQAHAVLGKWVHANARAYALQSILQLLAVLPAMGLVLVSLLRIEPQRASNPATESANEAG